MIFGVLARRGRKGKYLLLSSGVVAGAWGRLAARRRAWCERPAFEGAEREHLSRACYVARRRAPEILLVPASGL